jgi:hypothetical protein
MTRLWKLIFCVSATNLVMLQEQQVPWIPGDPRSCSARKVLADSVVFWVKASNRVCQRAQATHPTRHQVQEVYIYTRYGSYYYYISGWLVLLIMSKVYYVHSTNQFSIEYSHNGSCVQQDVSISNLLNGPLLITNCHLEVII